METGKYGWQDALWALGITGAAVAAYFVFRTPEPARTGLALLDLVCSRSAARAEAVQRHVAEPLELALPAGEDDGPRTLSHAELMGRLAELDALAPGCVFELEEWTIRGGSGAVWHEGMLVYSDSQPSDLHGRRRPLRAFFREDGGTWQLERAVLGPRERRLPEARP